MAVRWILALIVRPFIVARWLYPSFQRENRCIFKAGTLPADGINQTSSEVNKRVKRWMKIKNSKGAFEQPDSRR